jgi:hypothetical protein
VGTPIVKLWLRHCAPHFRVEPPQTQSWPWAFCDRQEYRGPQLYPGNLELLRAYLKIIIIGAYVKLRGICKNTPRKLPF